MPLATIVKENSRSYTRHDQLFKELIHTFFEEFLAVFFPEVHEATDFSSIKPLSEEVFTDLIEGDTRRLDIVVEAKLKQDDVVIIIHIEPQSTRQINFHERMYHYFSLLYNKYRNPIIPIAVYSFDDNWKKNNYTMDFPFFRVLSFHFMTLHLRKKNWRDYIESDNPAAAALLSKMGFAEDEKVQVKIEFLNMLVRMQISEAKQRLIYGFFETYLTLNDKEEEKFMEEVKQMPNADKILEIPISYEQKGIAKGKEIGKEIGKGIGIDITKKSIAIKMLKENLSIEFIAKVTELDIERVKELKERL